MRAGVHRDVAPPRPSGAGIEALRGGRATNELLVLYGCTVGEVRRLHPLAKQLGLTVQSVSQLQRLLVQDGRLERRDGRYRPTVRGVAWLHARLTGLAEDIARRLQALAIVRTTRAIAARPVKVGDAVRLEMEQGALTAYPGNGGSSRGRARSAGARGEIIEVGALEGIVPIEPGRIILLVVPTAPGSVVARRRAVLEEYRRVKPAWWGAHGLAAIALLRGMNGPTALQFGVGSACREASQLGVTSLVVVAEDELPRLLAGMGDPAGLPIELRPLRGGSG